MKYHGHVKNKLKLNNEQKNKRIRIGRHYYNLTTMKGCLDAINAGYSMRLLPQEFRERIEILIAMY